MTQTQWGEIPEKKPEKDYISIQGGVKLGKPSILMSLLSHMSLPVQLQ
jgi:hypothetical protein